MKQRACAIAVAVASVACACAKQTPDTPAGAVKSYPIGGTLDILTADGVVLDATTSSDGNGSAKITADAARVVRLYETGDIDAEHCRLTYRARLRTENVEGRVYLEMWCSFAGRGEYFSRALQVAPLTGTTDWTTQETPFFLDAGDNPDNVKLNVVIDGKGTVWIDDIQLAKGPLQ